MRKLHDQAIVARQVRTLFQLGAIGHWTDRELLDRFATRYGDAAEIAFETLMERHGPMVLRACRSMLRDPDEAQDAFQATFLLLARRAGSLWVRDSLGPWLHAVACRISAGRRVAEVRRRALERRFALSRARSPEPRRDDLGLALHEEIERLPERLRAPVVLCHLEGLTHESAADHLGCPVGTVRSRLSRGRDRLRRALIRRGFEPSSNPGSHQPLPAVPASLAGLTLNSVRLAAERGSLDLLARSLIFLTEGVFKTMIIHPLKSAAVVLLAVGAIAVGVGATSGQDPKPAEKLIVAGTPARESSEIDKRFEALEQRVKELEQKLEVAAPKPQAVLRVPNVDPNTLIKIRPRFDNALVEKVYVTQGESVRKGDPLLIIRSADVGLAKNECRTNYVQWDHDHKYRVAREPLAKDGRITQITWTETQNDEKKSRLNYLVSRERLATYGMTNEQIDKLLEGLSDDKAKVLEAVDNTEDLTRMTVVAPISGTVIGRDVVPGNFYDQKDILLQITPSKKPPGGFW